MLESIGNVANIRLLGGAEIIIRRMQSLTPDSQQHHTQSHFDHKKNHTPNSSTAPATLTAPSSYSTAIQVEFRSALDRVADDLPISVSTTEDAKLPKNLVGVKSMKLGSSLPTHSSVGDAWKHEQKRGEDTNPPPLLDIAA